MVTHVVVVASDSRPDTLVSPVDTYGHGGTHVRGDLIFSDTPIPLGSVSESVVRPVTGSPSRRDARGCRVDWQGGD